MIFLILLIKKMNHVIYNYVFTEVNIFIEVNKLSQIGILINSLLLINLNDCTPFHLFHSTVIVIQSDDNHTTKRYKF